MNLQNIDFFLVFLIFLPIIAFMFATVGHGGASGYLALMALFCFEPAVMKPTALLLNLDVAGVSFIFFKSNGHFNFKLFKSFAISSVPAAFLGGMIDINPSLYKKLLAVILFFAVLRLLNVFGKQSYKIIDVKMWQGLLCGALIGFFSGLIGIGGGIILSPLILMMKWGSIKEAAAVSALFIWVNSASGITGQMLSGSNFSSNALIFVVLVMAGGFLGSYMGSTKFSSRLLKQILAFVLIIACMKLVFA